MQWSVNYEKQHEQINSRMVEALTGRLEGIVSENLSDVDSGLTEIILLNLLEAEEKIYNSCMFAQTNADYFGELYSRTLSTVDPETSQEMFDQLSSVELRVSSYILQHPGAIGPPMEYVEYDEQDFKLRDRILHDEQKVAKLMQKLDKIEEDLPDAPRVLVNQALRRLVPPKPGKDAEDEEERKEAAKVFAEKMRRENLERAQRQKELIAKEEELKAQQADLARFEEEKRRNKELRKRQNENLMKLQAVDSILNRKGQGTKGN